MQSTVLARWHEMVAKNDFGDLEEILADEATFESPIVHTPQIGRAVTAKYLRAAASLLGNGSFRYVHEWSDERSAVLEFQARVGDVEVNGVDMIFWSPENRIVRFKVMIRPLKAIELLHRLMRMALESGALPG